MGSLLIEFHNCFTNLYENNYTVLTLKMKGVRGKNIYYFGVEIYCFGVYNNFTKLFYNN